MRAPATARALAPALLALALAGCLTPALPIPSGDLATGIFAEARSAIAENPFRDREADAAISPLDAQHVAVFYNERPRPYVTGAIVTDPITPGIIRQALAVSRDGGQTWTRSVLPHAGAAPAGSAWGAFCAMGDPNVVFDREGLLHVVTLFIECGGPYFGSSNGVLHATTSDDGATWSEPDVVWAGAGGLSGLFHDREWTAYDAGSDTLGIAWTALTAFGNRANLVAAFSTDGGRAWSVPQELETLTTGQGSTLNFNLHAAFGPDGRFHISAHGCPTGDGLTTGDSGTCLWHYAGAPGAAFARSQADLADCAGAPAEGRFDYAASAFGNGTWFLAAPALGSGAARLGTCVFASADDGATWGPGLWLGDADHPWLAPIPDGAALAFLDLAAGPDAAVPTLALLTPALQVRSRAPLAQAYDADTDDDGIPEYGDYDALATGGGRFVWALTAPNQQGRPAAPNEAWDDLDIWALRGNLR
jgi:hypothetical protein